MQRLAGERPATVRFHWSTNLAYPWEATPAVPLAQDTLGVVVAATVGRRCLGHANLATDAFGREGRHEAGGVDSRRVGPR